LALQAFCFRLGVFNECFSMFAIFHHLA
jgi:hypothetical protein